MAVMDASAWRITAVFGGPACPTGAVTTCEFAAGTDFDPGQTEALRTAYSTLHRAVSTSTCRLDHLLIKQGPQDRGRSFEVAVAQNGDQGNDTSSPAAATLIRKELANLSGRYAGRWYWPGVPDASVNDDGTWQLPALAQFQGACDAWVTAMTAVGLTPTVFGNTNEPRTISRFKVQSRIATQRRRLRR